MSVDPSAAGTDWFGTQGPMCTPEGDGPGYPEPEQNMSYNTPDGKPPASIWGFGDSFMCSVADPSASPAFCFDGSTVDVPIDPHQVGVWEDFGLLDAVLEGPDGIAENGQLKLQPDDSATLYYQGNNVKYILLNGKDAGLYGSVVVPFEEALMKADEAARTYEFLAVDENGLEERKVFRVQMVRDRLGGGIQVQFTYSLPANKAFKDKLKSQFANNGYFEVKDTKLQVEVMGRVSRASTVGVVEGTEVSKHFQKSISGSFSETFDAGTFSIKVTPKAKFAITKRDLIKDGKVDLKGALRIDLKAGVEVLVKIPIDKASLNFAVEISLVFFQLDWTTEGITGGAMMVEGLLSGSVQGRWSAYGYNFDGSVKFVGGVTVDPQWRKIGAELLKQFPGELAAVGAALIPVAIVVGGIATITVNMAALMKVWAIKDARDKIARASRETARGYLDGIRGYQPRSTSTVVDRDETAYEAGLASGANERAKLLREQFEPKGVLIGDWLAEHAEEAAVNAASQVQQKMSRAAWLSFGSDHWGTDGMVLNAQKWDWYYIYGGTCPQKMGGDYLNLWNQVRREDSSQPELSAGKW